MSFQIFNLLSKFTVVSLELEFYFSDNFVKNAEPYFFPSFILIPYILCQPSPPGGGGREKGAPAPCYIPPPACFKAVLPGFKAERIHPIHYIQYLSCQTFHQHQSPRRRGGVGVFIPLLIKPLI